MNARRRVTVIYMVPVNKRTYTDEYVGYVVVERGMDEYIIRRTDEGGDKTTPGNCKVTSDNCTEAVIYPREHVIRVHSVDLIAGRNVACHSDQREGDYPRIDDGTDSSDTEL